jgi:hypothetical protein
LRRSVEEEDIRRREPRAMRGGSRPLTTTADFALTKWALEEENDATDSDHSKTGSLSVKRVSHGESPSSVPSTYTHNTPSASPPPPVQPHKPIKLIIPSIKPHSVVPNSTLDHHRFAQVGTPLPKWALYEQLWRKPKTVTQPTVQSNLSSSQQKNRHHVQ